MSVVGYANIASAPMPPSINHVQALFAKYGATGGLWNFSDTSTLRQNSDGTGAVAVGDPVGYAEDLSGGVNHLIQAVAAARPVLQQDAAGRNYLAFDGVDDCLKTSPVYTLACPVYIATAITRLGSSTEIYVAVAVNGNNYGGLGSTTGSKGRNILRHNTLGQILTEQATLTLGVHVLDGLSIAGTTDVACDGCAPTTGANAWTSESVSAAQFGVSSAIGGAASAHHAYGGMFFFAQPAAGDRRLIQAWLGSLSGVTLV